jgi:predicted metal-dependent phosphoesterase TrpH
MENRSGKVDLHCHTKASDNSMTAEEVIRLAKDEGISHLAITDHDTTIGLAEANRLGDLHGVQIIPGIEMSAYDFKRNRRAHILGFYIEPGHPSLSRVIDPIVQQRHDASCQMVNRLIETGYTISWEQVKRYAQVGSAVYKQHIMHALMEQGYCKEILGPLHKTLFSRSGEGGQPGICHIPIQYMDAFDAIRAIREAGGVSVLAHPGQLNNYEAIAEWVEAGLEGIEVFHPSHDQEEEDKARSYAVQYGLIATGGSDYHGAYGNSMLGCKEVGFMVLQALQERRQRVI